MASFMMFFRFIHLLINLNQVYSLFRAHLYYHNQSLDSFHVAFQLLLDLQYLKSLFFQFFIFI